MDITLTNHTADAIGWFYLLSSGSRILAYGPQIALIRRSRDGARSVSMITWVSATISQLAAVSYGVLVTADPCFTAVAAGNLLGCSAIVGLAAARRYPYAIRRPRLAATSQHSAEANA